MRRLVAQSCTRPQPAQQLQFGRRHMVDELQGPGAGGAMLLGDVRGPGARRQQEGVGLRQRGGDGGDQRVVDHAGAAGHR
jgi:hypothetical protein